MSGYVHTTILAGILTGFDVLFVFLSLAVCSIGLISILKPLRPLKIKTRTAGFFVALGGFAAFIFFLAMFDYTLTPQEKEKFAANRAKQVAPTTASKQEAQPQQSKDGTSTPETKQPDKAAVLAVAMTQQLQKQGSDITVLGFDDVLVFDCTKALDPRTACYMLYKGYPPNQNELKVLHLMGIRTLQFQTESGLFSGYAWTKHIP